MSGIGKYFEEFTRNAVVSSCVFIKNLRDHSVIGHPTPDTSQIRKLIQVDGTCSALHSHYSGFPAFAAKLYVSRLAETKTNIIRNDMTARCEECAEIMMNGTRGRWQCVENIL